jgi:hypothetical protein
MLKTRVTAELIEGEKNRSHWLSMQHGRGGEFSSEELYPHATVTGLPRIAGPVHVETEANRYRHSEGWSEWRIFVRRVTPQNGIGDATLALIRDAVIPAVEEHLQSDEYKASRQRAAAYALRRLILAECGSLSTVTVQSMADEVNRHRADLSPEAATALRNAYIAADAMRGYLNKATDSDL